MSAYQFVKFTSNPLLQRKQFGLTVLHPDRANVPKAEIREYIAKKFRVADQNSIILYGFSTVFGGGRSNGMGLIYDSVHSAKKFEKKYRLVRAGIVKKEDKKSRRGRKEAKNKDKKATKKKTKK